MHALYFASSGTLDKTSAVKFTDTHQQGSCGLPVALAISMAHKLGSSQMGHFEGSIDLFMICGHKHLGSCTTYIVKIVGTCNFNIRVQLF